MKKCKFVQNMGRQVKNFMYNNQKIFSIHHTLLRKI